ASVERELDQAMADMREMEQHHAEDLRNFEQSLYEQVLREGATFTVGKANDGNGHADTGLGEKIKTAREEHGLSMRQLGDLCGISHTSVQRLEQYGRGDGLETVLQRLGLEQTPAPEAVR